VGVLVALRKPKAERPRHRRAKLNDTVVRRMRAGERIYDVEIAGMYAHRGTRGVTFRVMADLPTWAWKQRLEGPRTLERTVGRYGTGPEEISAKAARTLGRKMIADIKAGVDPKEPERGPDGMTLREAWEDYSTDFMVKRDRSEKTRRLYTFCFNRLKHWHGKPLALIAAHPEAIAKEHARIAREHHQKNSDGHAAADGSIAFLARIYKHARAKGGYKLPPWPDQAVVLYGRRSRAHRGMGSKDVAAWWAEAQRCEPVKREFLLFLLLSGLRAEDAMTSRWEHVHEQDMTLFVPAPKFHTEKRPRSFNLPVTEPMLRCLQRARNAWLANDQRTTSPWLFPSGRSKPGRIVDDRAQYTNEDGKICRVKTGHDLRHSFRNIALEAGVPEEVVGRLMNHRPRNITGAYHDPNATPQFYREAMEKISRKIMEVVAP
jgi:integrase